MQISLSDDSIVGPQLDITAPEMVQVQLRDDGKVLWVNVDGVCRLRISRIPKDSLSVLEEVK
jgi:hypothetical protein